MENQNKAFVYTYSAPEQDEVKKIREKYLPKAETKMDQLRRLDESTTKKGTVYALILGVFSILTLGIGMCFTMVWKNGLFVPGIIIGCVGIAGTVAAYPLFNRITKKERERLAPDILRLTNELMNGQA